MHYSYSVPAGIIRPAFSTQAIADAMRQAGARRAEADGRWPVILRTLKRLRDRGRRSIRIVDASCGAGDLLVEVARRARALGFVAIEARGIDRDPALIARARAAAKARADLAIGLAFEVGNADNALREEADFPADIVLYADNGPRDAALARIAVTAGKTALRAHEGPARRLAA